MEKRRVVITGLGAVTPYGFGADKLWEAIKEGKSAISKIESIPLDNQVVSVAGEIKNFEENCGLEPKEMKRMDRYTQLAVCAAREAAKDSGIDFENLDDPYRYGVILGTAAGGFDTFEKSHHVILDRGPTKCPPYTVPMIIVNMAAGKVSIMLHTKGINKAVVSACATSAHCIGDSFRSIQYGDADVIITGGCEAAITKLSIGAFSAARTLSKTEDPKTASRPFDKDRNGFVMSEGASVLVLEELNHALSRGAKIYGELVGYAQTSDAYDLVAPDPEGLGAAKSMELAVKDAGICVNDINYINAHGTSTHLGDLGETKAVAKVFGDLDKNPDLKISSTKSMTGHMLGAAGSTEAIISVKAIEEGIIPPTINLDNKDKEIPNLNFVPHKAIKENIKYALSNSFGFGGQNASLVFKKFEE